MVLLKGEHFGSESQILHCALCTVPFLFCLYQLRISTVGAVLKNGGHKIYIIQHLVINRLIIGLKQKKTKNNIHTFFN